MNETYILRELIYALQGVDGKLFQKDPKDMQTMILKVEMERNIKMQVLRYLECGWFYLKLRRFLTTFNNNPSAGLVLQVNLQNFKIFLKVFKMNQIFLGILCLHIC